MLKTGALPINLKPISETQVSATLGKQALHQGLIAGIVGFGLVLLFLLAFYRLLGVIAGVALFTYAGLFYGLIKLIPITLTLPGHRGTDPHDRDRGRLEHRDLRAHQGRVAWRADRRCRRSRRATSAASRRSSTRTSSR